MEIKQKLTRQRLNKRAIQLSVNFLVMLILGLFILGAGIVLTFKILNSTNDMTDLLDEQLKEQVLNSLDTSAKVNVILNPLTTHSGKAVKFPIGIFNLYHDKHKFLIKVKYKASYDKDGEISNYEPDFVKYIFMHEIGNRITEINTNIEIDANDKFAIGIPVLIKGKPGKYVLELWVCDKSPCDKDHKENLYDHKIHNLYVILK